MVFERHDNDDLAKAKVDLIGGSAAKDWLSRSRVGFQRFPTIKAGLNAVASGEIDAFVYDRPLLHYVIKQDYTRRLRLIPENSSDRITRSAFRRDRSCAKASNESLLRRIDGQP